MEKKMDKRRKRKYKKKKLGEKRIAKIRSKWNWI
jgi:hypothetical protein